MKTRQAEIEAFASIRVIRGQNFSLATLTRCVQDSTCHQTNLNRGMGLHLAQRMTHSHPLFQIYRIIKELRLALLFSHHDGNSPLSARQAFGTIFLRNRRLGNTRFRYDPNALPVALIFRSVADLQSALPTSVISAATAEDAAWDEA